MFEDARVDLKKLMSPRHLGHSSKEIGDKIGVSPSTVEQWRALHRCPNLWDLIKIRDAYPFEFSIEKEADRAEPILQRKRGTKQP
jgi:uncharacterized protein YjcR